MAECKHVFVGRSDGVHCTKCGMHMSAKEYASYLQSGQKDEVKPKRQTRKKVKTDE